MSAVADASRSARQLEATIRAGGRASEQALSVVGALITNQVKVLLTRNFPPASEPGEPPHLRTGGLRQSYKYEVHPARGRASARVVVASDKRTIQPVPPNRQVVYASYLEFGTSRMRPRPHLRPAVESIRPLIPGIIRVAWERGQRTRNPRVR